MKFILRRRKEREFIVSWLLGHKGLVNSVAFSPDGRLLASGSDDKRIGLRDVSDPESPRLIKRLEWHEEAINSLAFSPDGKLLASGSKDAKIGLRYIKGASGPRLISWLTGHESTVYSVAFSPDGKLLASGSGDDRVGLRDISDPKEPKLIKRLEGHRTPVHSVYFSPSGNLLASGSEKIGLRDISDPNDPKLIKRLEGIRGLTHSVTISSDGKLLAFVDNYSIEKPTSDKAIRSTENEHSDKDSIIEAILSLSSSINLSRIGIRDISNPKDPRLIGRWEVYKNDILSIGFSLDGNLLAYGSRDGILGLSYINKSGNKYKKLIIRLGCPIYSLSFSKKFLSFNCYDRVGIRNINGFKNSKLVEKISKNIYETVSIALSSDGKLLAIGLYKSISLWDLGNPKRPRLIKLLEGHEDYVLDVAFSPDGRLLASASADSKVGIRDIDKSINPRLIKLLEGHEEKVLKVAFSPKGEILVSSSEDHRICFWNIRNKYNPRPIGFLCLPILPYSRLFFIGNRLVIQPSDDIALTLDVFDIKNPKLIEFTIPPFLASKSKYMIKRFLTLVVLYRGDKLLSIVPPPPKETSYKVIDGEDWLALTIYLDPLATFYFPYIPPKESFLRRLLGILYRFKLRSLLNRFPKEPLNILKEASRKGLLRPLVRKLLEFGLIEEKDSVYYVRPPAEKIEGEIIRVEADKEKLGEIMEEFFVGFKTK